MLNSSPSIRVVLFVLVLIGVIAELGLAKAADGAALVRSPIRVHDLKTEHLSEPLGIETQQSRLRWLLQSQERGQRQSAYQIWVASSPEKLQAGHAHKWNSGKVASDNFVEVPYAGRALASGERAYWKVRVWDEKDRASPWSEPSFFEMGLLSPNDWQGQWIGAGQEVSSPLLRRSFEVASKVRHARVYLSGLGYYELSINGRKVGERMLDPAPTTYHSDPSSKLGSRVLYATYDVTDSLRAGENVVGVMLGRGWYSFDPRVHPLDAELPRRPYADRPHLLLQMNIELEDGRRISVVSNEDWKTSPGPITYNDLALGERYDARLEQPGWNAPGFDDRSWTEVVRIDAPTGRLMAQNMPPVRVIETLPVAQRITPTSPMQAVFNAQIFDFGQNFSGWVRLAVKGPRGTRLEMTYGAGYTRRTARSMRAAALSLPEAQTKPMSIS